MRHSPPSLAVSVGFLLGASISSVFGQKVYWTSLGEARFTAVGALNRAELDGTNLETLIESGVGRFVVDSARGSLFWLSDSDSLRRADLDGSNIEDLVLGMDDARGLAIDVEAGKLYWNVRFLDTNVKKIQRANLDGSNIEDLVVTGLLSSAGITLDTQAGKMYWINGISNTKVLRANLDGSEVEDLFTTELRDLGGFNLSYLALDLRRGKMYITSSTNAPPGGHIFRASLDGSELEELRIAGLINPRGIGVDAVSARIYWADDEVGVRRADLNGFFLEVLVDDADALNVVVDLPRDCNGNGVSDEADVSDGASADCNANHIPDECEPDCNGNGVPDGCDLATGTSNDCNANSLPDECEPDCNNNGIADECDITAGTSEDCTGDRVPDDCDPDCNINGVPDTCDIAVGLEPDCNTNGLLDRCELTNATLKDENGNGVPDVCDTKIYWTDTAQDKIRRANSDGSGAEDLVITGLDQPKGIALDVVNAQMYWFDNVTGKIHRANLDGSGVEELFTPVGGLRGLALDLYHGKMYWIGGSIRRANLDGSEVETLLTDLNKARGLTLSVVTGKMYWAQDGIRRANLDGSNVETLPMDSAEARSVALDLARAKIYWVEGADSGEVRRANLDGTGTETLAQGGEQLLQIVVDSPGRKLYWVDSTLGVVHRSDLDGSGAEIIVGDATQPWAIALDSPAPDCNANGVSDWNEILSGDSADCNTNGIPDECIDSESDCNGNGLPDACDIASGASADCSGNGMPDECEADCNDNGLADSCDIAVGTSLDCNGTGVPDACELADGASQDCDGSGVPDECERDCNGNGLHDMCDVADGASRDCDGNGVPDECQEDCNANGVPDSCDLADETSDDCNGNGVPEECDILGSGPRDAIAEDECVDAVLVCPGFTYVGSGSLATRDGAISQDCGDSDREADVWYRYTPFTDGQLTLAVCGTNDFGGRGRAVSVHAACPGTALNELACLRTSRHCSRDPKLTVDVVGGQTYFIRIGGGGFEMTFEGPVCLLTSSDVYDCNANGVADTCDLADGTSEDCNGNGVPDECDFDCNGTGVGDQCDIADGTSQDCTGNGVPDECEPDCNDNGVADSCDILDGTSQNVNRNGVPDECDPGIRWRAVAVNGNPIVPTTDVTALPGDRIRTEFVYSPWSREKLSAYRISVEPEGYTSGFSGSIAPPGDPGPDDGFFVDIGRSDWIFEGLTDEAATCVTTDTQHAWCYAQVSRSVCTAGNPGASDYLATLVLDASQNAEGVFNLTMGRGGFSPLLTDCDGSLIEALVLTSLTVRIGQDCNANGVLDHLDISAGTSRDANQNDVPDECEVPTNRYLTMATGTSGRRQAVRVTFVALPAPFDGQTGDAMWVGPPVATSEAAGVLDPGDAPGYPVFRAATLQCDPFFADWGAFGGVKVYHNLIVPEASYRIEWIDEGLPVEDANFSAGYDAPTARWGDVTGPLVDGQPTPPDGQVNIVADVLAIISAFGNRPGGVSKTRADLHPETPDGQIQILDIVLALDAFRGLPYPFEPSGVPCGE